MTKPLKLGVVMDPIEGIRRPLYESTVHILHAAEQQHFEIAYLAQPELFVLDGKAYGEARFLHVNKDNPSWFSEYDKKTLPLSDFDIILMRKDPPFNIPYIYATYILELAEKAGTLVVNKPQSLRDANEKLFTAHFPQCCAPTLVSSNRTLLHEFWKQQRAVVFKPLHGMGGQDIFIADDKEPNVTVIIEMLTQKGTLPILAQLYLPQIHETGDKRILMIDGKPIPYALARFPAEGETRGNLAAGGHGVVVELNERDRWLCSQIGPVLKSKQIMLAGVDVIGDYITEINITSPTGIPSIVEKVPIDIAGLLIKTLREKYDSLHTC